MKKMMIALPVAAALAACGSNGGGDGAAAKQQLKVVGSSTVYPFTTAVAEQFQRDNPNVSAVVESTGTGAGMKLFCGGVGANFPDIENASRQIKKSEYDSCVAAGVKNVIEVPVGIDGLTFIQAKGTEPLNLTQADIYKALAANPFGKGANTAQTWKDVNPALPAIKIRVLGPPPTSGTRDSLVELYLEKGCNSDPAMKALKESDEAKHKDVCTKVREDGLFVEAGENDNLLVQKVTSDPGTVGILGYSFLEENADKVSPGPDQRRLADRSDDRRSFLPGRPQALHLPEGRASGGQAGASRLRRGLFQGMGARAARWSSADWFRWPAPTSKLPTSRRPS